MSLTSLMDEEVIRTEQVALQHRLQPRVLSYVEAMVPKYKISPEQIESLSKDLLPLAAEDTVEKTSGSNALDSLVRYIPTEAVTLYVAACSAMPALKDTFASVNEVRVYWFFVIITPLLALLIFAGKRRSAKLTAFPPLPKWPWWKLVASTIAFLVWALAVPTAPYLNGGAGDASGAGGAVAALAALLVSTFLGLLDPIIQGPKDP